jgi:hypothetical protein
LPFQFGSLSLTESAPAAAAAVATATATDNLRQQIERMQLVAADAASSTALQLPLAAASAAGATAMGAGLAGCSFMQFVCAPPPAPSAAHATSTSYAASAAAADANASLSDNTTAGKIQPLQVSSTNATQHSSSAAAAASRSSSSSSSAAFSFTASREVTHQVVATTTTTRDTLTMHAAPAAGGTVPSTVFTPATQHTSSSSSMAQLEPHERVGVLGEAFAFSLLQRKLPGFDECCWHSSARKFWPSSESPLQPPLKDPSYDFLYEDVQGQLSGTPGTLCFIECKATSDDAAADGGRVSTRAFPISQHEWKLARLVKQQSTQQKPAMYIVVCVDRVGQVGGPRLVAVLRDPVGMLQAGQLWLTGQELLLCDFPVCS